MSHDHAHDHAHDHPHGSDLSPVEARVRALEPRLRDAKVIEVVTGLRPDRPSVRVEAERLGAAWCVHNYGHGGNGVSLSWGCAREVVELAGRLR